MARDTWYRLDNVGKFYSSQAGSSAQTVFRYAAELVDDVDEDVLQRALDKTVDTFPGFNVCLRSGMFWHYLEQSAKRPLVTRENLPICFGLHVHAKSVLFRVSHYRNRVNLEVSHIVSDGRGTLNFFKALLYAYLQERYGVEGVSPEYDGSDHQKSENSFDKYYERDKAASTRAPKVYRISGWRDVADPTYLEYHLPVGSVLDLARSHGVSLTSLVIAAVMCAIRDEMPRRERHRAIRIDIPVDLRQFFKSTTTKNFFGLAFVTYTPGEADEPVEQVAAHVQEQLETATLVENLKPRMNRMIALEKNPLLRLAPLFVKDAILELASRLTARETTTTVSNLGRIRIDERLAPYVRSVNLLTSTTGINFLLCSFGDDLCVGISTAFSNPDVVKNFCRYFSAQGIEGYVNINKTSEEVAEDLLETKFEASVKRLGGQAPAHDEADVQDGRRAKRGSGPGEEHEERAEAETGGRSARRARAQENKQASRGANAEKSRRGGEASHRTNTRKPEPSAPHAGAEDGIANTTPQCLSAQRTNRHADAEDVECGRLRPEPKKDERRRKKPARTKAADKREAQS